MTFPMTSRSAAHGADVVGVILAGGRSSRMGGVDKAGVLLAGEPMLAHVRRRVEPQVLALAVNRPAGTLLPMAPDLPVLPDTHPGQPGPLAGVLAGLRWALAHPTNPQWLLTVPADTPFLPDDVVPRLLAAARALPQAIVMAAADTGVHPTLALWPADAALADALEAWLGAGGRRMTRFPDAAGRLALAVPFPPAPDGTDPFSNINTPADLAAAERRLSGLPAGPLVFGIAGWKDSGKTTLTVALVAELTRRGLQVATVKHAHHGFDIDQPGKDSARHRAAGAVAVTIVSSRRIAHIRELGNAPEPTLGQVLAQMDPAGIVLVEGFKRAGLPKVEVRRQAAPGEPLHPADATVIAIAADHPVAATVPVFALDDAPGLATFLLGYRGPWLAA